MLSLLDGWEGRQLQRSFINWKKERRVGMKRSLVELKETQIVDADEEKWRQSKGWKGGPYSRRNRHLNEGGRGVLKKKLQRKTRRTASLSKERK